MKDVLVLVATGYEDTELVSTLNVFKRNEISYDVVSIENFLQTVGKNETIIDSKKIMDISDLTTYRTLFLPGGPGHKILIESPQVIDLIKLFNEEGKIISAICAAPDILIKAEIIGDKKITSHPDHGKSKNNTGKPVEVDKNIITGRDYKTTIEFAETIVKQLEKMSK